MTVELPGLAVEVWLAERGRVCEAARLALKNKAALAIEAGNLREDWTRLQGDALAAGSLIRTASDSEKLEIQDNAALAQVRSDNAQTKFRAVNGELTAFCEWFSLNYQLPIEGREPGPDRIEQAARLFAAKAKAAAMEAINNG